MMGDEKLSSKQIPPPVLFPHFVLRKIERERETHHNDAATCHSINSLSTWYMFFQMSLVMGRDLMEL